MEKINLEEMILERNNLKSSNYVENKSVQDFINELNIEEYNIQIKRRCIKDETLKIYYTTMQEEATGQAIVTNVTISLAYMEKPFFHIDAFVPALPIKFRGRINDKFIFIYNNRLCVIEEGGNAYATYSLCTITDKNMKLIKRKYSDLSNLTEEEAIEIVSLCEKKTVTK